MFDYGHIFPRQKCWFGEKLAFLTQKTWFHAISRLFSFPTIFICKKWAKYNFTAMAKFRRNRFGYSNTPKHVQNWLFLGIFSFFLFLRSFFLRTLRTQNLFFYLSNVGWNIPNDRFMPQVYKKRNFQIWLKTKLSSLQSTVGWMPNSLRNIHSQDIPKGRPGTFQQDVRGHSNRMSCNVLFLDFHLIFVPPIHIYEQLISVRQL